MSNPAKTRTAAVIGLVNPKSPANIGSVMRAAGCFGAAGVFYTGTRFERAARFNTDTKDISSRIPLNAASDLLDVAPADCKIVCIELVEGAISLADFQHPHAAFYIFGPEDGTISQQLIDHADAVVYIPTTGCLNLAATVNIVLYDRSAKSPPTTTGDVLIRASRDTNNRVKVRTHP
ncbi:MAG: RNA methyltransferase [Pseudomonadales bacterium]|nr:RNA methyltransferase [Pseudomonadales bacterium]MDP4640975.1 RNA methyltransferase [Pseudomonadales bacterium]MDP4766194.1 RNA methyltransferase [Pseudomonadales bacterium]MDP4874600.1 RNA methyltransferase [Pseudomonadales bacterium]MDP4911732.1 RNA methyltransferase [Pseudomonadales bacterium]